MAKNLASISKRSHFENNSIVNNTLSLMKSNINTTSSQLIIRHNLSNLINILTISKLIKKEISIVLEINSKDTK